MPLRPRMHMLREEVTNHEPEAGAEPAPLLTLLALRSQFLRFLKGRLAYPTQAEDILQNCYIRALEHTGALNEAESSRAWFYRILRNALIDYHRRSAVEDRALANWASELELEVVPNDLAEGVVCRCIEQVLPTLHASYAEILTSIELNEGRLADFAAANHISQANATVRLHRARKALKQRLVETCGSCSVHGCLDCTCTQKPHALTV